MRTATVRDEASGVLQAFADTGTRLIARTRADLRGNGAGVPWFAFDEKAVAAFSDAGWRRIS